MDPNFSIPGDAGAREGSGRDTDLVRGRAYPYGVKKQIVTRSTVHAVYMGGYNILYINKKRSRELLSIYDTRQGGAESHPSLTVAYKSATHCGLYFTKDDVVDATAQMYCCAAPRPPC